MSDIEKFQNASAEEAKKIVLDSINPNCKEVGNNFFTCIESRLLSLTNSANANYSDIEKKMVSEYTPQCMTKFNLEDCLSKYDK